MVSCEPAQAGRARLSAPPAHPVVGDAGFSPDRAYRVVGRAMSHYMEMCVHGRIMGQCRCPSNSKTVRTVKCDAQCYVNAAYLVMGKCSECGKQTDTLPCPHCSEALDGATDVGSPFSYPRTPGEFAARWNAASQEWRENWLRQAIRDSEIAGRAQVGLPPILPE